MGVLTARGIVRRARWRCSLRATAPPSARTADLPICNSGLTTMNLMKPRHFQPGASKQRRITGENLSSQVTFKHLSVNLSIPCLSQKSRFVAPGQFRQAVASS